MRQVYGTVPASYRDRLAVIQSSKHTILTHDHSLRRLFDHPGITYYLSHLWQFHLHCWRVEGLEGDVGDPLAALADEGGVGHVPLLSIVITIMPLMSISLTCLRSIQDWVGLKVGQEPQPASTTEARVMITSHTGIWTTERENSSQPRGNSGSGIVMGCFYKVKSAALVINQRAVTTAGIVVGRGM